MRINRVVPRVATSPLKSSHNSGTINHEGGLGYNSDAKSMLFRLGVNLFAGKEDTYYESGKSRDDTFTKLVETVAIQDPKWIAGFLGWLRKDGYIRTASIMGAAHAVHARLEAGAVDTTHNVRGYNRTIIDSVCQRADEPGELAAYWTANFGHTLPKPVKRGLADAAQRLYNEYSLMKYDTASHAWRFGDVIQMARVAPNASFQDDLFGYAIARRYGNDFDLGDSSLKMVRSNLNLRNMAVHDATVLLNPEFLKQAGMTWEDTLSLAGTRLAKKAIWESFIDSGLLGHMAMLRNLRNMEEAGISMSHIGKVQDAISDPEIVAKGMQFPFRYYSAFKNVSGAQWSWPLEQALNLSVRNIPVLDGATDIYIDTSGSMAAPLSAKGTMRRDEAAAIFGTAVALKNAGRVRLFAFATSWQEYNVPAGGSVLKLTEKIMRDNGKIGYGTETVNALRATNNGAKRVMIFTDGQSFSSRHGTLDMQVKPGTWMYGFDLAGYQTFDVPSGEGRIHQLAGLSDSTFKMIPLLERQGTASWPWEG